MESKRTAERILDSAQGLIQLGGYEGFSFASVASEIGLRKASIHHHFPTKAHLALSLIRRYRESLRRELSAIGSASKGVKQKLEAYAELYVAALGRDHRLCLGGMYAAEFPALPEAVQEEVRAFFRDHERWLKQVLSEGAASGELGFEGKPEETARLVLSTLEGAMLIARAERDERYLSGVARRLIQGLLESRPSQSRAPAAQRAKEASSVAHSRPRSKKPFEAKARAARPDATRASGRARR